MDYFSRRCKAVFGIAGTIAVGGLALVMAPRVSHAQVGDIVQVVGQTNALLHDGSKLYLGVDLEDVTADKAQTLKLKEVRGAVVTLIDHDAPAAQAGIEVNDVILSLNGQKVENVTQFWQMFYHYPAGNMVSVMISRNGELQTLALKLATKRAVEHEASDRIGNGGDVFPSAGMGMLSSGGQSPVSGGFHLPFFGSTLNVGALVEPLTSQMAEYLGVASGLMVKQVARKSEAAISGLKAFDVILKVGTEKVTNVSGWDRALRANQGKPIPVTILRDRRQQVVMLQVDSKRPGGPATEQKPVAAPATQLAAPVQAVQTDATAH
ncbi:MAG TPA: PDZ domain-containing protein [Terracidiphilus sp.]|nr:PDZ domain-containing protein [Terracidiphilus sp.]